MGGILEDIKSGTFKRVYLLYGPESFLRLDHAKRLAEAIVPAGDAMNRAEMGGEGATEQAIIDFAESLPFFGERRLVLIKDSAFFEKSCEQLPDYLSRIPEHSTLLFCETHADKRNRLYAAVKKYGCVAEYALPDRRKDKAGFAEALRLRKTWAGKLLLDAGLRITEQDMDYLLARVGYQMSTIRLEVDKLANACAGQDAVTRADIDLCCTAQLQDRVFEMVEAVVKNDSATALALYADLLALNTKPTQILFHLGREYRQLLAIRDFRDDALPGEAIAEKLGLHPYLVKKKIPVAMRNASSELQEKLSVIAKAEEDIKSGRLSDRLACESVILFLMPRSY